jgi:hypothetical protein
MLFGETVTLYCENHTEHKYTVWAEYVKASGAYTSHQALKG